MTEYWDDIALKKDRAGVNVSEIWHG